jgi:hypothetical protein
MIFSRYISSKAFKHFMEQHIGTLAIECDNIIKYSALKGLNKKRRQSLGNRLYRILPEFLRFGRRAEAENVFKDSAKKNQKNNGSKSNSP